MQRVLPRAGLVAFVIAMLILAACDLPGQSSITTQGSTGLCTGSHPASGPSSSGDLGTPYSGGSPTGPVPASQPIHLNITLSINQQALDACLQSINNPSSADYNHFLSPQDIAAHFAPSSTDVDKVKSFLTGNGLTVTQTYNTDAAMVVDGTAAQVEKAFSVTLNDYQKNGSTVYAPDRPATLPSDVQNLITNIAGLSDNAPQQCVNHNCSFINHYSHFMMPTTKPTTPKDLTCTAQAIAGDGTAVLGGSTLLLWSDLSNSYGLANLAQAGYDGSGTSIGMVEFDTYDANDIKAYTDCAGTTGTNRVQNVVVDKGNTGDPGPDGNPGAGEAELDL